MSEEDRIDEIIRSLSADYNRPPETPRDEMWAAIQAARSAPGPRLHVTAGGASTGYRNERKFGPRFAPWMGMAAAAVLLVATGVGIGRYTSRPTTAPTVTMNPVRVASEPQPIPGAPTDEPGAPSPAPSVPSGNGDVSQTHNPRTRDQIRQNPQIKGNGRLTPLGGTQLAQGPQASSNGVYQVATLRHLADAEALLTSFSLESKDQRMDRNFADWAKGLLSNTRLLLDSPAGDDPRRAKLLQDLELVLAQIVQLSPNAAATDRELIQGSIQNGQVITRLRTAIPAGEARAILER
ncbi:MAG TPA: hypothetical protein VF042_14875 [Gemmatimonadaceae bacterium]